MKAQIISFSHAIAQHAIAFHPLTQPHSHTHTPTRSLASVPPKPALANLAQNIPHNSCGSSLPSSFRLGFPLTSNPIVFPKRKAREMWLAGRSAAGVAALVGIVLLLSPTPLTRWSYDLPHLVRPEVDVTNVVLVYLDDVSHTRLHQKYDRAWQREVHADLINALTQYGAKAIAYDELFTEEENANGGSDKFAAAIRNHGRVVLGADLGTGDYFFGRVDETKISWPHSNLVAATPHWGFVQLNPDSDDRIREPYHGWEDVPSLSWKMAQLVGAPITKEPRGQRKIIWLNYYGPRGTLKSLSFWKALDRKDPEVAKFFKGKIVFIGSATQSGFSGKRRDQFHSPFSLLRENLWPGVDIHATQFLNLQRGDYLLRMDPVVEVSLMLFLGLLIGGGLAVLRPKTSALVAVFGGIVFVGVITLSVWHTLFWFNWLIPLAIQVPIGLAFAIGRRQPAPIPIPTDLTTEFQPGTYQSGTTVADHVLLRKVGHGSYGDVWLARSATGTYRAIKIVDQKSAADPRFEREFAGLKKFEPVSRAHEGLVDILHVGRNDSAGHFYYVMEVADSCSVPPEEDPDGYVPCTLKSKLESRGSLKPEDCIRISYALASALAFMHKQGLVHRDIKPSNIIFVANEPKLADIGLVAEADETKSFVGTEGYIPPEGPGTPAADVYSLGKVLSEVSAGTKGSTHEPSLEALQQVIERASARNVRQRYQTGIEMLTDLKKILSPNV